MIIYGVGLLAACTLTGITIGKLLGVLLGIPANVGGVGIAMIMLIVFGSYLKRTGKITSPTEQGVAFWSAMYIPIVVAMAAKQNVFGALSGGPMAITAGVVAVSVGFILVPLIAKIGEQENKHIESTPQE